MTSPAGSGTAFEDVSPLELSSGSEEEWEGGYEADEMEKLVTEITDDLLYNLLLDDTVHALNSIEDRRSTRKLVQRARLKGIRPLSPSPLSTLTNNNNNTNSTMMSTNNLLLTNNPLFATGTTSASTSPHVIRSFSPMFDGHNLSGSGEVMVDGSTNMNHPSLNINTTTSQTNNTIISSGDYLETSFNDGQEALALEPPLSASEKKKLRRQAIQLS